MCPYEKMREAAKVFYPGDPAVLCADVISTSTDMWHYTIPTPRSNAADHIFRMNTILAVFMTAATLLLYYEPA
ncbi:unnamed protein product [Anisakis simplex]|uniref:Transmembrane protein n=1 Tax=Anisakis simplex TaxID=6269 RepID=A0A0M3J524_ANISI|nr:unnamed protein product [Anisakis simplex]